VRLEFLFFWSAMDDFINAGMELPDEAQLWQHNGAVVGRADIRYGVVPGFGVYPLTQAVAASCTNTIRHCSVAFNI
jgi:hypothetical protein